MIVGKRLLPYTLLFTMIINSFTLQASQSTPWMSYITNSFVSLRNYIGQSIVKHKKAAIVCTVIVGTAATAYYLRTRHLRQQPSIRAQQEIADQHKQEELLIKDIIKYQREIFTKFKETFIL